MADTTVPSIIDAFEPAQLGPLTLRNRIIKAATFEGVMPRGAVTDELIDRLRNAEASEIAAPVALSSGGTPVGQVVLDDRGCF